jgi:hypothetical protein
MTIRGGAVGASLKSRRCEGETSLVQGIVSVSRTRPITTPALSAPRYSRRTASRANSVHERACVATESSHCGVPV